MLEFLGPILSGIGSAASAFTRGPGDTSQQWSQFNQNYQNQKEFAQHGIRWKVEDAKAAGIHPLFALGGSTASYSPSTFSVGDQGGSDYGLKGMGQAVDRAVAATRTSEERKLTDFQVKSQELDLEGKRLDNEIRRAKLASDAQRLSQSQIGPPMPSSMTDTGQFKIKPAEVTASDPQRPFAEAGPNRPGLVYRKLPGDVLVPALPEGWNMDDFSSPGYLASQYQTKVLPWAQQFFGKEPLGKPDKKDLPQGAIDWEFKFPGVWSPRYPDYDAIIDRSRHNRVVPKWADPKYRRF